VSIVFPIEFFPLLKVATDVYADMSLVVPGFDEQPLSVKELGVADGRTTWEFVGGKPTGTFEQADFPATGNFLSQHAAVPAQYALLATLVEGPRDAVFLYGDAEQSFTVSYSCAFQGTGGGAESCNFLYAYPTETSSGLIMDTACPGRSYFSTRFEFSKIVGHAFPLGIWVWVRQWQ
jgi:hypothetical protein